VELEPEDFDANVNLSACYFQLGKYRLAEQYCKAAIKIFPGSARAYSNLGIIYDSQNLLYPAIRAYKTSLELDPNQPKLLLNLGSTYVRQKRYKAALNAFELATQHTGEDPDPWIQVGLCHYHTRNYGKAITAYSKALTLSGASHAAHRGLGVVYMTQFVRGGKKDAVLRDRGLEAWHRSLEIQPNQEDLRQLIRTYSPPESTAQL